MQTVTPNIIHPSRISEMEQTLRSRGIPVAELCRQAGIAETTWGRWKNGSVSPTFKSWDAVNASYLQLIKTKASESAA